VEENEPDSAAEVEGAETADEGNSAVERETRRWRLTNQTILAVTQLLVALTTLLTLVLHGNGGPA
jgi:hypothetical protein